MTLYKYTSAKCAYNYLRTGGVEVELCGNRYGIISFSTKTWSESKLLQMDGVVLEFSTPDDFILHHKNCLRGSDRVMRVEVSSCGLYGSSYFYKVGNEFNLLSFTIGPDCQMKCKYVHSQLKNIGKGDAAIKFLRKHERNGVLYVDKEYRMNTHGMYCLKYNSNHPTCRDEVSMTGNE